ncbi:MAG: FAD-dependent 5-carboxymethylaminomethyl-2-thiouridine(34) oxidoreductase MnmC [Methylobacillus sp.]|jgi:tRNA 5-methylaminomethyl-2-thiouridine biosynthesis bifunctional protein|nr:FAD-dependent 5-carboxymethylaminomethyl-2-thiouridine(34) oxidoreductase MnmC [Methylobacillus sp.]
MKTMNPAQPMLDWQNGQPVSALYGDVYFSRASGIAETRHVFLRGNRLRERWATLARDHFTIAETGFGTGLNFLCAWQLWREAAPPDARLHFVSAEKFPLANDELQRALALWPELAEFSRQLIARYRRIVPGWQRLTFDEGRVTLTLLVGDARATLPQLAADVDAWFLDGFSPAKNSEMWQPEIFRAIARLATPGCTFATFTSAGFVRRGLQDAGFVVEKTEGYGSKREMLRGEILSFFTLTPTPLPQAGEGTATPFSSGEGNATPLASREKGRTTKLPSPPVGEGWGRGGAARCAASLSANNKHAVIIGGGIAGASSAHALTTRGWQVTLIERHAALAQEASGNPQGVLYPRLSGHDIPLSRIALGGFSHTLRLAETLLEKGRDWDDCGLLQQAFNAREAKRCAEVAARSLPEDLVRAVNATEASALTGLEMPHGGLWFPHGAWLHPPALCDALARHPAIRKILSCEPLTLKKTRDGWQIFDHANLVAAAPVVIICAANDSLRFAPHLPLEPVRGQITQIPATEISRRLKAVVCTEGYISPARNDSHCAGASFSPGDTDPAPRPQDHTRNLAMLRALSPALFDGLGGKQLDPSALNGRVSLRCASPDYLPLAGQLLDAALLAQRYEIGSRKPPDELPWLEGLFVNIAHGSKGLLTAPLCAELIAATLTSEPLPVDSALARALDPNRFLLRERGLKRLVGAAVPPHGQV